VDNGRSDWYHMLHDSVEHPNAFGGKEHLNLPQMLEYYCSLSDENVVVAIQVSARCRYLRTGTTYKRLIYSFSRLLNECSACKGVLYTPVNYFAF
jgi:hypothetical protein